MTEPMGITRRQWMVAGAAGTLAGAVPLAGHGAAPELPATARIVLGFPAGSAADVACRLFAMAMQGRYAKVGSSRVDLQACKLEYSIVSPK